MSRKLKGGSCGCGSSSGLLGFPQNGGQMNSFTSNTSKRSNLMPHKLSRKNSSISTKNIVHHNGKTLNQHLDNIQSQIQNIKTSKNSTNTNSTNTNSTSPGLFGGGLFDFLMPKPHAPPMPQPTGVSQRTLPTNQPPTLQEVVRDLQFRVKALEEETHPPSVGGYRATKRNLNALKKWKQGKSIGFTMRSSLKAKGLIPRANGTRRVSKKYQ